MLGALLGIILALATLAPMAAVLGAARQFQIHVAIAIAATGTVLVATAGLLVGSDGGETLSLPLGVPWLAAHFRLDALAAWFLLLVNLAGASAAVYAIGYVPHLSEPHRALPALPVFLAGMNLVILADDAFTFLFGWELMSLSSWLLVLANHRRAEVPRAAQLYLVMALLGTACLLLAFGLLAGQTGAYRFADMRRIHADTALGGVAIALAILGTASKAGLVPLHAWLPLAHPAAPAHVSALMSGAMTKVALYAMARVLFDLAGPVPWGWGALLIALGAASALLGILQALVERDAKTLLAYSTIENVGVATLGLGLAIIFQASALPSLAALATTAALFHMLNHALMKSLMFFVAGAIEQATRTRDLEQLGGLIHRMKTTAVVALVGAAALSALPPLNGFVSEWLTFQAVLNAPTLPQWVLRFGVPLAGAAIALAAALAAATFVRFYGIAFLGRPRGAAAAAAEDAPAIMRHVMAVLAGACVAIGLLPAIVAALMAPAVRALVGADFPPFADGIQAFDLLWLAPVTPGVSSYGGLAVLIAVILSVWATLEVTHRLGGDRLRRGPAWDCGFPDPSPATQYTASSFAQPLRRVFGPIALDARETVDMPEPGDARAARIEVTTVDRAWRALYAPAIAAVGWLADRFNRTQFLTIRRYLAFMFTALVTLLIAVAVMP